MRPAASWKKPLSTGRAVLEIPSVSLLIGKERFLKREYILAMRQRLFPEDSNPETNFQEFVAEQDSLHSFLDFLSTAPFAADHRLAVLWGVDALEDEEQEKLEAAIEKLPASSVCVLETEQTNAKKDAFLRNISEKAKLVPCHTPFDRDLPAWIEARARKLECSMPRQAALFLIACIGPHLAELDSALEQLSVFVHPKQLVTLEDVRALFQRKSHEDIFQLAELLYDRQTSHALRITDELFRQGSRVPEMVAALAGQLERWKKGARWLEAGRALPEIAQELRVPVFFQESFFVRLKKLSIERLKALTEGLLICDESFKSGQVEERLALEKFIWSV